jgi:D-methionine transport system ATP-binding protein
MLKLKNISKYFYANKEKQIALDNINLEIQDGEIFGIVGKSGVGKSTLLKILSLQLKPDTGEYFIDNKNTLTFNTKEKTTFLRSTSFVYQNFSLLYNSTVLDNILLPLKILKVPKDVQIKRAKEMLEFVGLSHKANEYPITLSGGEAQRISIARALVTEPNILFLDEITSSLDLETSFDILDLILKIHKTFKPTIIFISHQIDAIKYLCERVMLLENGKVKRIEKISNHKLKSYTYEELLWQS